jgi:hypothetical protein
MVGDNADALAVVTDIFNSRFQDIIDGVQGGVDELTRLKQQIADYLKGLQVGELSPLTPQEQLAQAKEAFQNELALASSGDKKALGDITQFADAYLKEARESFASSQAFTDIFNTVTGQLGGLAGTTPQGEPLTGTAALDSALPAAGEKIASDADIAQLTAAITNNAGSATGAFTQTSAAQAESQSALTGALPEAGERLASNADVAQLTTAIDASRTATDILAQAARVAVSRDPALQSFLAGVLPEAGQRLVSNTDLAGLTTAIGALGSGLAGTAPLSGSSTTDQTALASTQLDAYLREMRDLFASSQSLLGRISVAEPVLAVSGNTIDSGSAAIIRALSATSEKALSPEDLEAGLMELGNKLIEAIAALAKSNSSDSEIAAAELKAALVSIGEEITAR